MSWWTVPDVPALTASLVVFIIEVETTERNFVYVVPPTPHSASLVVAPQYNSARDQASILIEKITQTYFQDNIKKFLPYEFWRKDAIAIEDGGGGGNLENYVEVFAITLDEIKQAIDEFTLIFDIDHCPPKYLRVIAEMINYPLESSDSTAVQRTQLKSAIEWYKSKGSRRAFISILYAFGYHADVIPLWTQHTDDNPYQVFTETIPGVARGNDPPNDFPLLVENGGTWFRSPHYGIRLKAIVNDRHATIEWGSLTPEELPITEELVNYAPDSSLTSFSGSLKHVPMLSGTLTGSTYVLGAPLGDIVDDGAGNLSGTDITGTIDYDTGAWTLEFVTAPTFNADIIFNYTYDFSALVLEVGYHRAFYQMVDELAKEDVVLRYYLSDDDFWYMWRRIEFIRPAFAVLDWIEHGLEMYEWGPVPTEPDNVITVNPVRDEKGWYLGYCDLDDIQYNRLDARLLGPDFLTLDTPLGAGAPTVEHIVLPPGTPNEEIATVAEDDVVALNGTLDNQWLYPGVSIVVTIGGLDYTLGDNGEGVLVGEDETVYGLIDYIAGTWDLAFEGVNPDNPSSVYIDYYYTTEVPPCDRSGAFPRGSTALPFPHLRDPQEGYCHPPEDLFIDWTWLPEEPYTLPLTRDGMNLYPSAGPVPFIDHADFPSRGFTDAGGDAGHANTFTREFGYSTRPLSLLRVRAEAAGVPEPDAENWENQNTDWDVWTGPWENIGD